MSTIVVTIKTNEADATQFAQAGQPHRCLTNVRNALEAIATGSKLGGVDVQVSAADPVRASGTLTTVYATIVNGSTIVIGGTTLTCVTGTPNVDYSEFKKVTDLATTIANMAAAINGHATTSKLVSAAVTSTGVVTVTAHAAGTVGNQITLVGGTGVTAGAANLASGAGGAGSRAVSYRG